MELLKDKKIQLTIATAIAVLFFIVGITSKYTTAQNKVEDRLCNLEDKMISVTEAIEKLDKKSHIQELQYTEIKVKLTSIESLLLEEFKKR